MTSLNVKVPPTENKIIKYVSNLYLDIKTSTITTDNPHPCKHPKILLLSAIRYSLRM